MLNIGWKINEVYVFLTVSFYWKNLYNVTFEKIPHFFLPIKKMEIFCDERENNVYDVQDVNMFRKLNILYDQPTQKENFSC